MAAVEYFDVDTVVQEAGNEGYGLALVDAETNLIIEAYIDPGNWQWLEFPMLEGVSRCGKYLAVIHSGQLEFRQYF